MIRSIFINTSSPDPFSYKEKGNLLFSLSFQEREVCPDTSGGEVLDYFKDGHSSVLRKEKTPGLQRHKATKQIQ